MMTTASPAGAWRGGVLRGCGSGWLRGSKRTPQRCVYVGEEGGEEGGGAVLTGGSLGLREEGRGPSLRVVTGLPWSQIVK